jgi:hypothetical protein
MTTPTEGKIETPPCSICNTVPNPETGQCRCPRPSDRWAPGTALSSSTLVTQAESLFESYLAARLVRARRTLTTAKVALLRDPRNQAKRDALRAAELETHRLHSQLLDQKRKSAETRERTARSAGPNTAVASREATDDFRLAQAVKAETAYRSGETPDGSPRSRPDDRDCPGCGERLPGDALVCACGYRFASTEKGPIAEPFLTEEEVAALRGRPSKYRE